MKRRTLIRLLAAVLLVATVATACSSGEHMYKHRRSDCDCPRFD